MRGDWGRMGAKATVQALSAAWSQKLDYLFCRGRKKLIEKIWALKKQLSPSWPDFQTDRNILGQQKFVKCCGRVRKNTSYLSD